MSYPDNDIHGRNIRTTLVWYEVLLYTMYKIQYPSKAPYRNFRKFKVRVDVPWKIKANPQKTQTIFFKQQINTFESKTNLKGCLPPREKMQHRKIESKPDLPNKLEFFILS